MCCVAYFLRNRRRRNGAYGAPQANRNDFSTNQSYDYIQPMAAADGHPSKY